MNSNTLTGFRFFAALVVVIFHFGQDTGLAHLAFEFMTAGQQMVTFFFVLSGFVMILVYLDKPQVSHGAYWFARLARIGPVYYLALFFSILIFFNPHHPRDNSIGVLLNFFLMQAWVPSYALSVNGPAWSLSVEFFFYFCFPFVVVALRNWAPKPTVLLCLSLLFYATTQMVFSLLFHSDYFSDHTLTILQVIMYSPASHFCSFLLGCSGAYLLKRGGKQQSYGNSAAWTAAFVLVLLLVFLVLNNRSDFQFLFGYRVAIESSFLAPLFLLFVLVSVNSKNRLASLFCIPPLLVLGNASYGIYILQRPTWFYLNKYVFPKFTLSGDLRFYFYLAILIGFSIFIYYALERPVRKWMLQAFSGRTP